MNCRRRVWRCIAATTLGFVLVPVPAAAQVQGFMLAGSFRIGSDEGKIASGPGLGAGATLALSSHWLFEFDGNSAKVIRRRHDDSFYETRRTLLIGSLLHRWTGKKFYIFAGGGAGIEFVDFKWREDNFADSYTPSPPWAEIRPRVYEWRGREKRAITFAPRAGVVFFPASWLGLRVDSILADWHYAIRFGIALGPASGR